MVVFGEMRGVVAFKEMRGGVVFGEMSGVVVFREMRGVVVYIWELLEKKDPRGPSHSPTASYLESGLWTEHQHHMALPAGQTSLTQVTLSSPNQNTPLLCTPSNFNICNYSTFYSFTQL